MTIDQFHSFSRIFCVAFEASVSSSHRTIEHNRRVGGASNSQHLHWKAHDFVLDDWSRKDEAIDWLKKFGLFVLDEVVSKNHLHVDDRFNVNL